MVRGTLSDDIASRIMGEIDELTRRIDNIVNNVDIQFKNLPIVVKSIDDSKHNLAVLLNNLVIETKAAKAQQDKLINDRLALGLGEIEAQKNAQIQVIDQAAQHITADEREAMKANAEQARDAAVIGVLEIIERTVAQGLKGVTAANQTFGVTGEQFRMQIDSCVGAAKEAVKGYNTALTISAQEHEPMGKFGYFMLSMSTAVVGGCLVAFLVGHQFFIGDTTKLSSAQAEAIAQGQQFGQVYAKLDAKTKAKIDALWNQK